MDEPPPFAPAVEAAIRAIVREELARSFADYADADMNARIVEGWAAYIEKEYGSAAAAAYREQQHAAAQHLPLVGRDRKTE